MSNTPDLIAYSVIEKGKHKDPVWHRVGAGWQNKSGNGFTIQLQSMPLDGRIVLIPPKTDDPYPDQGEGRENY